MTEDSKTMNASPVAPALQDDTALDSLDPDLAAPSQFPNNEDSALALLQRADLPPDLIEKLSKNNGATKSRKVKLAIIRHPKTPRYVSLSLLRKLFTFDLMQVALTPAVAGDLKMAAEEALIHRLETISTGEKLSLARRASGRVASALLVDTDSRIITAALENPRLTESLVIRVLLQNETSSGLVQTVCFHSKWSLRREIRIALLRNEHTTLEHAIEFAKSLPNDVVREILQDSNLPENVKACLTQNIQP
jgi:hypothetical protein